MKLFLKPLLSLLLVSLAFLGFYFNSAKAAKPLKSDIKQVTEPVFSKPAVSFEPSKETKTGEVPKQEKKEEKQDFIEEYNNKSSLFYIKSMSVACDEACELEWQNFLQSPQTVAHSKRVLRDLAFAQQEHGDQQAYARLMAIESLKRSADLNGPEVIEESIQELFLNFEKNKFFKGARNDLSDLLDLWIQSYGKEQVLANPDLFFAKFIYKPEYKDIFVAALGYSFPEVVSDPEKSQIFMEVLKNYE